MGTEDCANGAATPITRIITRLNVGGPARQELALTGVLRQRGLDAELVAGRVDPGEGHAAGADSVDRVVPTLQRDLHPARDFRALASLTAHLRSRAPSVVHTHMAKAGALGRMAALAAGIPAVVHTFHGHVLEGYFSPRETKAFLACERVLARRTDALVAVSQAIADELLDLGVGRPGQWHITPLGLALDDLLHQEVSPGRCRLALGIPPGCPLVTFISRLVPVKEPDLFLDAARIIAAELPEAHFVVAGDGPMRAALESRARGLLGDRVRFLGWANDVATLYQAADVVMLTSAHEGTPATLIEAAAAARPVVATDVGGVRDVVLDGLTGHLVGSGDARGLARATLGLLAHPDQAAAMGVAGRRHAQRFSVGRLAEDLVGLYGEILAAKQYHRGVRLRRVPADVGLALGTGVRLLPPRVGSGAG